MAPVQPGQYTEWPSGATHFSQLQPYERIQNVVKILTEARAPAKHRFHPAARNQALMFRPARKARRLANQRHAKASLISLSLSLPLRLSASLIVPPVLYWQEVHSLSSSSRTKGSAHFQGWDIFSSVFLSHKGCSAGALKVHKLPSRQGKSQAH